MSQHKIEREAVLWAWKTLLDTTPTEGAIQAAVYAVLKGEAPAPIAQVVRVAIAYVESAKNHVDTVLELETNLATVTAERDALKSQVADIERTTRAYFARRESVGDYPCRTSEGLALALAAGVVK